MKNIDFKKLTNDGINYIKDYPLFMIINFLAFIMVIFAFIVSALLGLVIIILWLTGIIIFIKTGGYERMNNKKKVKNVRLLVHHRQNQMYNQMKNENIFTIL